MTFSAFLVETLALIEEGYVVRAFLNIGMSLLLCLLACWVGLSLGRSL
jgi:CrcB protein